MATFTERELELAKNLRTKFGEIYANPKDDLEKYIVDWIGKNSDQILTKFIDENEEKAVEKLTKALKWKHNINIDDILQNWTPNEKVEKFYRVAGFAKNGYPVTFSPFGRLELNKLCKEGLRAEIEKYCIKSMELFSRLKNPVTGKQADKFIQITDLTGFSFSQVSNMDVIGVISETTRIYESYFPFSAHEMIIVNGPIYFSPILRVVKKIMNKKSAEAIKFYGNSDNSWKEKLEEIIDEDNLPVELGGKSTGNKQYELCF